MSEELAYNGKILNVDLTTGSAEAEELPDQFYKDYLGGYGMGARILFDDDRTPSRAGRPGAANPGEPACPPSPPSPSAP